MTCNGEYKRDRICELCEIANADEFKICKRSYTNRINSDKKLKRIYDKCPYRHVSGYGYDTYDECGITDCGNCNPTLDCAKYIDD
jgi:hypothetical protein